MRIKATIEGKLAYPDDYSGVEDITGTIGNDVRGEVTYLFEGEDEPKVTVELVSDESPQNDEEARVGPRTSTPIDEGDSDETDDGDDSVDVAEDAGEGPASQDPDTLPGQTAAAQEARGIDPENRVDESDEEE